MDQRSQVEIFKEKPPHFASAVEVAAIYLEVGGRVLLLQRASTCKSEPNTWALPGGKLDPFEKPLDAAKRELFEETGILEEQEERWKYRGILYIRKPGLDYTYNLFEVSFDDFPNVCLSPREHQDFRWVTFSEMWEMKLISGAKEVFDSLF